LVELQVIPKWGNGPVWVNLCQGRPTVGRSTEEERRRERGVCNECGRGCAVHPRLACYVCVRERFVCMVEGNIKRLDSYPRRGASNARAVNIEPSNILGHLG
jgi:hypothetical protein